MLKTAVKIMIDPRSIWNTDAEVKRRPIPDSVVPPRSHSAGSKQTKVDLRVMGLASGNLD